MNDGDHEINTDSDPDLSLHSIGACSVVMLDAEVASNQAEEQLDSPAQTINRGDGQSRNLQLVGQEDQVSSSFFVEGAHLAQQGGDVLSCLWQSGFADLVAAKSGRLIDGLRMPRRANALCQSGSESDPAKLSSRAFRWHLPMPIWISVRENPNGISHSVSHPGSRRYLSIPPAMAVEQRPLL